MTGQRSVTRRDLLRGAAAGALLSLAPSLARAAARDERRLDFVHLHTQESLSVVYFAAGAYRASARGQLDHHLRDHRTGEKKAIDPRLLDLLHRLRAETAAREPYQVISGYRSPTTNAMLKRKGRGVGTRSYHMKGMAIDVRLADVESRRLREAALDLRRGGVGYYENSDFVHVDVGPIRSW